MAANKVPGVRAAPCHDAAAAQNAREHNDANVLTLGARVRGRAAPARRSWRSSCAAQCTRGAPRAPRCEDRGHRGGATQVTDPRAGRADRARRAGAAAAWTSPPARCHAAAGGCCPDRLGRLLGHGADRFGLQAGTGLYPREIARLIDHTLLKPEATRGADRDALRGGARARLRHGLREPGLGARCAPSCCAAPRPASARSSASRWARPCRR